MIYAFLAVIAAFVFVTVVFYKSYGAQEESEFRVAARQFAKDVMEGRTPSTRVTEQLVSHNEPFDHRLASPHFFDKYGALVTYEAAVLRFQQEMEAKKARRMRRKAVDDRFRQLADRARSLLNQASSTWDEVRRTVCAVNGQTGFVGLPDLLKIDALAVVSAFSTAEGRVTRGLGRLQNCVSRAWGASGPLSDAVDEIERFPRQKIELPVILQALSLMDAMTGSRRCAEAAAILDTLARSAAKACSDSLPVKTVLAKYEELLHPYLPSTEDPSGQQSQEQGSTAECKRCRDALKLLELPIGASLPDVQMARRELARNFHPDSFGEKRGQHFAEEHLKEINVACDHLLRCRYAE